ncbi:MAG: restriction endonuclease subunit S [Deltaproteobacteria bacterium]|nr:restriction endonuclease subunit S [Deltaproteobacteria bacterium]
MVNLITDQIDIWTSAQIQRTNGAGRGNHSANNSLHGIKKLRELILELAVRGKLVPQEPKDEPASVLLEKIAKEKARLIKEGKIKKEKPLPAISDEEKPFALPKGWEWARLPDISAYKPGKTPSTKNPIYWSNDSTGIPWVSISDMKHFGLITDTDKRITQAAVDQIFKYDVTPAGSLLMSFKLTVGKISILDIDAYHNEAIISIQPFMGLSRDYLFKFLPKRALAGNTKSAIMGNTLNADSIALLLIPVPPLAEQHRIVAKVDELMDLCDQLEQQQSYCDAAHQRLVEVMLATLTSATNQDEFVDAWHRIANHFDVLFTTEQSVDQLKQIILQLAVMGKLVSQEPKDEPASVLLEKIAKEKARLIKEGKVKKQDRLLKITDDEKPFEIPHGWVWVRFGEVVNFKSDLVNPNDYLDWDQIAPDSIEKGTGKLLFRRTVAESGVKGPNNKFCTGQILYSKIRPSLSKAIVAAFDGLCSADMYPLDPMIDSQFLLKDILSNTFLVQVRIAENRVKMPKLNIQSLSNIIIPIPPLAEQNRIVAKVDELMAVCDTFAERIKDAQTTQVQLADAIVEQAII